MAERLKDDRIEDYTEGKFHRSPDEVRDGIANRIKIAAPGDVLHLREGTADLFYDEIKDLTWGKVLELLAEAGIVSNVAGRYVKSAVSFGVYDGVLETSIFKAVSRQVTLRDTAVDVLSRGGYKKLIEKFAGEFCKILYAEKFVPDFSCHACGLAEDLADVSYGRDYFFPGASHVDGHQLFLDRKKVIYRFLKNLLKYSGCKDSPDINDFKLNQVADRFEYYIFAHMSEVARFPNKEASKKFETGLPSFTSSEFGQTSSEFSSTELPV